jgi:hypothetical protein
MACQPTRQQASEHTVEEFLKTRDEECTCYYLSAALYALLIQAQIYALLLISFGGQTFKNARGESPESETRAMRSDRLPVPSHDGLRTSSAIHSESRDLDLLRLENKQLRELVVQLSQIVLKNVLEAKRLGSDCSPIALSQPPVCSPTWQPSSAPSFWPSGSRT